MCAASILSASNMETRLWKERDIPSCSSIMAQCSFHHQKDHKRTECPSPTEEQNKGLMLCETPAFNVHLVIYNSILQERMFHTVARDWSTSCYLIQRFFTQSII